MTKIEWTDESWGPIAAFDRETGKRGWFCTKVSPGCKHCFAERLNLWVGNGHAYTVPNLEKVELRLVNLEKPLRWKKPRRIFPCSMTDLFHEAVPDEFIVKILGVMLEARHHTYQILTKRPERMAAFFREFWKAAGRLAFFHGDEPHEWPLEFAEGEFAAEYVARAVAPHIWLGVSIENQKTADERIPHLLRTPAAVRWLSVEPMLAPLDLTPWLEGNYNPVHGNQTQRKSAVRSGNAGTSRDRHLGACLENSRAPGQQMGCTPDDQEGETATGGARHGKLSAGSLDGGREADPGAGPSSSLDALQRPSSRRLDDQSQEREEAGQPPPEPRTGDSFRERETCDAHFESGSPCEPMGRDEPPFKADDQTGERDTEAPGRRREIEQHSGGLRRDLPNNIEDSPQGSLVGISWVVCGGESGARARPMQPVWARSLRDQCQAAGVPFFFKQISKKAPIPVDLQIREYPNVR